MAAIVGIQTSFNAGKVGNRMKGRVDLQRMKFACEELQNFVCTTQGPAIKRSGTRYVKTVPQSRLIPFEVSDATAYMIELSDGRMRFYRSSGALLETAQTLTTTAPTAANPVVVTCTSHGFSDGDSVYITGSLMTELNGRFFTVSGSTANTFELYGENGTGRSTGLAGTVARHYGIVDGVSSNDIPWLTDDLFRIKYVQNGDLMYLVHPDYPPHLLTRAGDQNWTCIAMVFAYPPFETENTDANIGMSITNTSKGANTTITANSSVFASTDVGRYITIGETLEANNGKWIAGNEVADRCSRNNTYNTGTQYYNDGRLYAVNQTSGANRFGYVPPTHENGTYSDGNTTLRFVNWGGYGYGTITGYNNSTSVNVTVNLEFSYNVSDTAGNYSTKWAFGAWGEVNGYPRAIGFYENRLYMAGTTEEPQTFWGSQSGIYDDFRIRPASLDSMGLQFTLLSDRLNTIEWLQGEDVLFVGTYGGEFSVDSGSATLGITPSNVRVRRRSNYGTISTVQPRTVDAAVLFVRRSTDMHQLTYTSDQERYIAPDLTAWSENILRPGVVEITSQPDPLRLVWALRSDGTLAALAYDTTQDVAGWSEVVINGTVESVASIPHPDGDKDQVWLVTRRTINGATVRHIEYLEAFFRPVDDQVDAFFVDGGATYDAAPATVITGLWHLEGEEVVVFADGGRVANQTVTRGRITLDTPASVVSVGLQMPSAKLQTIRQELATTEGSAQGQRGRISNLVIRVDTMGEGLEYGTNFDTMDLWDRRTESMALDSPVPLYTGDSPNFELPSEWDQSHMIAVRHDEPTPCTVVAFMGRLDVERG